MKTATHHYVLPVRLQRGHTGSAMTVPIVVDVSPAKWWGATAIYRAAMTCHVVQWMDLLFPEWVVTELAQPITPAEWERRT